MMTPQLPLAGVPLGNLKRTRVLKVHQKAVLDSVHEVTGLTVTGDQADQIASAVRTKASRVTKFRLEEHGVLLQDASEIPLAR